MSRTQPSRSVGRVVPSLLAAVVLAAAGCDQGERGSAGDATNTRPSASEAAPAPTVDPGVWFVDEAATRGLDFVHRSGHRENLYYIPEMTVGGAALFDMDDDGFLDVYVVQSGRLETPVESQPGNRLYRNRGDGTFEDVTAGSGADDRGYGNGVTAGDYDGDGDVDLFVTNVGPNTLLRNDGGGRFADVTAHSGVGDDAYSTGAAFVDYDHDGDLDLFVLNYLVWSIETERSCDNDLGEPDYCAPAAYKNPAFDVLYRNEGDGTFTDVTTEANVGSALGTGLGIVCADFDRDGLTDVFVANDGMPDRLWVNLGDGRFEDRGMISGCALDQDGVAKAGMGVTVADLDDDGDLDLMVCNVHGESDSMFRNEGEWFADATAVSGLASTSRAFTRFGMAWVDFDNDGRLDLYQANGRVARRAKFHREDDPYAEPNLLFRGGHDGRFEEVKPRGGTSRPLVATSRGAAFGDLDNDGGIDVVVVNRDGPVHLLRNTVGGRGHWIMFRVLDEHGGVALGATVTAQIGERSISREVRVAYSYCVSNDPRIHIGLGPVTEIADVSVQWPDGARQHFGDVNGVDRIVTLRRDAGRLQTE